MSKKFDVFMESITNDENDMASPVSFDYPFHAFTRDSKFTSAATSINNNVNTNFLNAVQQHFAPGSTVIDYGAGKYGRVANALRELGYKVFAYDPYNGTDGVDGWNGVSTTLPLGIKFENGFSSFVLNVVDVDTQAQIVGEVESYVTGKILHIVRGGDIVPTVHNVITGKSKNPYIMGYVELNHPELFRKIVDGKATKEDAKWLAVNGIATKADSLQRWPTLADDGYEKSGPTSGTIWVK